ncbi:hypothetical protein H6783_02220 [Candidatus Nomurabacteria bacterium]|nr:hypothetical protein [Candidatus Nomurabacteria bacterium]
MSFDPSPQAKFIPVKEAAKLVGYTTDYVAKLAREGKVDARRNGRQWFVGRDSVKLFSLQQEELKKTRQQELKEQRLRERHGEVSTASPSVAKIEKQESGAHEALATTAVVFASICIMTVLSLSVVENKISFSDIGATIAGLAARVGSVANVIDGTDWWPPQGLHQVALDGEAVGGLRDLPQVDSNEARILLPNNENATSAARYFSDEVMVKTSANGAVITPVFRSGTSEQAFVIEDSTE